MAIWPTASAITYGQTLAASASIGGSATAAGSFAFTTPLEAPGAGTAQQSVIFTPANTANYNIAIGWVSLTVNSGKMDIQTVTILSIVPNGNGTATVTCQGVPRTPFLGT